MVKGPGDISAVLRYGEPCSRSGIPPGPLPNFTSIYKYFGGVEETEDAMERGGERERESERASASARLAKAENVGSYENPFQVKNGLARNTLGTWSVTLQAGGVSAGRSRKKVRLERACTRVNVPKTTARVKRQKGGRGLSLHGKNLNGIGPISSSLFGRCKERKFLENRLNVYSYAGYRLTSPHCTIDLQRFRPNWGKEQWHQEISSSHVGCVF